LHNTLFAATLLFAQILSVSQQTSKTVEEKSMPYQSKREPLSDDEVNQITNACDTFRQKFVVWTLLDTGLRLSGFADLKKDNIQWQKRGIAIYVQDFPSSSKVRQSNHFFLPN